MFKTMKKIAIFASGSGTNAENIIKYFRKAEQNVDFIILSNNPKAKVLERAKQLEVQSFTFDKKDLYENGRVLEILQNFDPDLIVLAGFLWLIPDDLIKSYPNRIINIHPALLPKYGGKGMYGDKVHQAVLQNKEQFSGITIHYINNEYDKGMIIFQSQCPVNEDDTVETLAKKIHELEYKYYPQVIENLLKKLDYAS